MAPPDGWPTYPSKEEPPPNLMPQLEKIDNEYFSVRFQYDRGIVHQLRQLNTRRWNPELKQWEVHIAHLAEIMRIFRIRPDGVPPELMRLYQSRWIQPKIRIHAGNSFAQMEGGQIPLDSIDQASSFPMHGHQFDLNYLDGKWDGRKHLLDRRNFAFPSGLLDRVLVALRKEGAQFELEDLRPAAPLDMPEKPFEGLAPWQSEALQAMISHQRGILELAPGAGRWIIASRILRGFKEQAVIFTPDEGSQETAWRMLENLLGESIGRVDGGRMMENRVTLIPLTVANMAFTPPPELSVPDDPHRPATPVWACNKLISALIRQAGMVLADGLHSIPAESIYQAIMRCSAARWRFGFSATPHRADGHDMLLEAALGPVIHRTPVSVLIEAKRSTPARILCVWPKNYPPCERDRPPEEIFERAVLHNEFRHKLTAEWARKFASEGRRVAVLAHDAEHIHHLMNVLPEAALAPPQEFSPLAAPDTRGGEAAAQAPAIRLASMPGETLLSDPRIDALIFAAPPSDEMKALELICRALQTAPGKNECMILDFLDSVPYLKDRGQKRLSLYEAQTAFKVDRIE